MLQSILKTIRKGGARMSQDKTTSLLVDEEQLSLDLIEAQYFLKRNDTTQK